MRSYSEYIHVRMCVFADFMDGLSFRVIVGRSDSLDKGSDEIRCSLNGLGENTSWEQRKLGEVVTFAKGSGYSKSDLTETGTPIILYGRLYTKYETIIRDIDTFSDAKEDSVFSQGGEVIVPASGETAEDISVASVVEKPGVLLGGDLNIIHPGKEVDAIFLAISVSNGEPHSDMARRAQGKSVVHLHNEDLSQIKLCYPSIREQSKISSFFSEMDDLITLHQRWWKWLHLMWCR